MLHIPKELEKGSLTKGCTMPPKFDGKNTARMLSTKSLSTRIMDEVFSCFIALEVLFYTVAIL
eukprot:scaffold576_cov146-Chaetoceros_neogracile.AAC.8